MKTAIQLKNYRKIHNLTQEAVARKIGIPKTTYASYEQGKAETPLYILIELSEFYNVSIDDLVKEKEFYTLEISKEQYTELVGLKDSVENIFSFFKHKNAPKKKESK